MDIKEFRKLAKAGTTVYLTSCALLISAFIHAATQDLSVYHAMIVLNLSWLNNATAVIPLSLTLLATSFRREGMYTLWKSEEPNLKSVRHSLIAELIACLLHFCIMAAFGIWLFSRISTFDKASSNCTPSTVFYFLGHDVPVTNKHFSNLWLYIYYYTLIPVVNVVTLLVLCFSPTLLLVHLLSRYTNQFRKGKVAGRAIKIIIGGAAAIFLELIIIIGTEGTISRNTVAPGEHIWTFGQTLALLVMVFLAWDLFKDLKDSYRGKQWRRARESSRSARSTASLMDAVDVCFTCPPLKLLQHDPSSRDWKKMCSDYSIFIWTMTSMNWIMTA
jgi:hypothetical protein